MLDHYEVPAAYAMIELAQLTPEPFHEFMCYWTAFNSIYTTIAEKQGNTAHLKVDGAGAIRTRANGSVQIPMVEPALSEREEIELAFKHFGDSLKHSLLNHPSCAFFARRIPKWHGRRIEVDTLGQRLNGVMNLRLTPDEMHPVWSPIDIQAFERWSNGRPNEGDVDLLSKQVLFVIYTVRNNTFHGGKRADDANDREVIRKGLPLLKMIVEHFIQVPRKTGALSVGSD